MCHNRLKRSGHVALVVLLVLFSHPALAATIVVDNTMCNLVDAVTAANTDSPTGGCSAGSGADTIVLTADLMTTGSSPLVSSEITVAGNDFTIEA